MYYTPARRNCVIETSRTDLIKPKEMRKIAKAKMLPSGNWRVQVSTGEKDESGKYKYISITAPTEKEANFAALEYELKQKHRHLYPESVTLHEAIDKYISMKDKILSPSTIAGYRNMQKSHMKGISNKSLNRITNADIQKEINKGSVKIFL